MNARRSSTKKRNRLKTELTTCSNLNQHCDFCVLSFPTRAELKVHVLTHFKKTTCMKTQKTLLLIVDDWFELHINDNCCTEHSPNTFEATANLVCIDDEVTVKKEEKIEENDTTASCIINDVVGDVPTKIEIDSGTEYFDGNLSDSSSEFSVEKIEPKVKKSKQVKNDDASLVTTKAKKNPTRIKQKTKKLNGNDKVIDRKTKPTKCRICKQKFPADGIIAHLQSRHVPRILPIPKCETCGKTFSTPGNLRSHQYLHAERGRYICSYCGKEFVRNANLKEHINLHTGARPFVCEVCKKTFHRETLLRNHRRIHTGEKKYRCNIENCDRAYMFDIDLKRHKFSVHGIYSKKHPCFICSKIFSENKLLKKHLETH